MATITIKLDVKNVKEVVESKKGRFATWMARKMKGDEFLKEKVEEVICEEVVTGLRKQLDLRFKEEGILASFKVKVSKD